MAISIHMHGTEREERRSIVVRRGGPLEIDGISSFDSSIPNTFKWSCIAHVILGVFAVVALAAVSLKGNEDSHSSGWEWKRKKCRNSSNSKLAIRNHHDDHNHLDTKEENAAPITTMLQERFPECAVYFQKDVLDINLKKDGHYVPSTSPPRYDYLSCFTMKARYNCAHSDKNRSKEEATDYKFVLRHQQRSIADAGEYCDVRAVIDYVGGPSGVARALLLGKEQHLKRRKKLHVLLVGNSYVRQILEAMACGWRLNITYNAFQVGGPTFNTRSQRFIETKMEPIGLGNMTFVNYQHEGCHGMQQQTDNLASYYRPDIGEIPTTIPGCDDNIAILEFDSVFRVSYVFAGFARNEKVMTHILQKVLHVHENQTDYFAWNDNASRLVPASLLTRAQSRPIQNLLPKMRNIQKIQLQYWFGADNPWITVIPDSHPCMPGMPDDEVNLFLFSLLTNSQFV